MKSSPPSLAGRACGASTCDGRPAVAWFPQAVGRVAGCAEHLDALAHDPATGAKGREAWQPSGESPGAPIVGYDEITGEVFEHRGPMPAEPPRKARGKRTAPAGVPLLTGGGGRRGRVPRTPEEVERARKARDERELAKHGRDAIWEALFPSLLSPGDPPIGKGRQPTIAAPGDPDPRGIMFTVERLSGSGLPGSRLVVARGYYDGLGARGGPAYDYVKLYTEYDGPGGYRARSTCVAVRASELRAVAAEFLAEAERLEVAGEGEERESDPQRQQGSALSLSSGGEP